MNAEDRQPASTVGDCGTPTGPIGTGPDATGSAHRAAVRRRLLEDGRARGLYSGATWSLGDTAGPYDRGWTGTRSLDGPALDGHDLWDLASVTKPMVGLVVMALVDRGVVGLDDTVGHHLTRYSNSPHAARTVAQLLDHTAGLPGASRSTATTPPVSPCSRRSAHCRAPPSPVPMSPTPPRGSCCSASSPNRPRARAWTG